MQINYVFAFPAYEKETWKRTLRIMKALILILWISLTGAYASTYAQTKISIHQENTTIKKVIEEIQQKSEFVFFYKDEQVNINQRVSVIADNKTIDEILAKVLHPKGLDYKIIGRQIVIIPKKMASISFATINTPEEQPPIIITGKVTGKDGNPLPGVTIAIKGTTRGAITDANGNYKLQLLSGDKILVITSIGMKKAEVVINDRKVINVVMEEETTSIDNNVIVTGYFTRDKNSFTGNAKVVTGTELLNAGNQNVLKSLSLIDPSIAIIENNEAGSNPNALPTIRFRGESQFQGFESLDKTGLVGDPNLPTFILDGYQTTLQTILDLDMYRVESVTILKDAAATAIYGSRASNGVVVVKTKQPKEGQLSINYNVDADFNFPDISDYNLLNAKENMALYDKFKMYRNDDGTLRPQYNQIATWLAQGVNTNWLAQPLRNAVGQKHSLDLSGGDKRMRYSLNMRYSDNQGVMKESFRKNLGIGVNLQYNMNDKFLFSNNLTVDRNNQQESPYGSFSNYTSMNSFFPIYDANGKLYKYYPHANDTDAGLDYYWGNSVALNPLYEASVGNIDKSNTTNITDNFAVDWTINAALRLRAQLSYTHSTGETINFVSPNSSVYPDYQGYFGTVTDEDERGKYTYANSQTNALNSNMVLSYSKKIQDHFINASVGANMAQNTNSVYGFVAQGFSSGDTPDPSYAKGYEVGGSPSSTKGTTRLVGVFGSINYTYNNRFLVDASYRLDGSSQFGSNKKTAPFYSIGTGWNIHNEPFMRKNKIFNKLKLRATYGETGSVSFSAYQAKDMYSYYKDIRYDGAIAAYLMAMGNNNLRWQNTINREVGIEASIFNRADISLSYYDNKTKNMVLPVTTPPSMGFESITANLGQMSNKGYEANIRVLLIKKKDLNISVYATAYHNKNRILSISSALSAYNNDIDNRANYSSDAAYKQASHKLLVRYNEGQSTTAIYAVRSLGIDPMTGQEFFLTKDGAPTLTWSAADKVVVGDTEPIARGTIGTSTGWKGLYLNLTFSYQYKGQVYNQTLVDKVENSNKFGNVDKRVLYDTWQAPGDEAYLKANLTTRLTSTYTYASSRFVQDYSYLNLSAASLQYEVPQKYLPHIGLKSLRISINMSDVFQLSTVQRERGLNYPYAHSYSFGLRTNF